jgi:hypothetical protein
LWITGDPLPVEITDEPESVDEIFSLSLSMRYLVSMKYFRFRLRSAEGKLVLT